MTRILIAFVAQGYKMITIMCADSFSQPNSRLQQYKAKMARDEMIRIRCTKETRKLFYVFKVDMGFSSYEDALRWLLANAPKKLRLAI